MTLPRAIGLVGALLALALVAGAPAVSAQDGNLVVQVSTEPPGLDLTASPAVAIAAVVFYNVQEALVKVDRHGKLVYRDAVPGIGRMVGINMDHDDNIYVNYR